MATPNTTVRPTAFPRFDTRDHTQDRTGDVINIDYKRRDFEYAAKDIPKGKTALLQGYCRFIAAFTGEYEPSFECALRYDTQAQPRREVVSAEVLGEDSEDLSNDVLLEIKHDVTTIERVGFGFELLVDPEDFDTLNTRPVLDCVSSSGVCEQFETIADGTASLLLCSTMSHSRELSYITTAAYWTKTSRTQLSMF